MKGLKFITQEDLCLQEQLNIKFEQQGTYTLNTLREVQSLTEIRCLHTRWWVWLREHFRMYIEYKDLSRSVYDKFEDGDLCYREDCYDSYSYFEIPLLSQGDLVVIKSKMLSIISDYDIELKENKIKFEATKLEEELALLKQLSEKYMEVIN